MFSVGFLFVWGIFGDMVDFVVLGWSKKTPNKQEISLKLPIPELEVSS